MANMSFSKPFYLPFHNLSIFPKTHYIFAFLILPRSKSISIPVGSKTLWWKLCLWLPNKDGCIKRVVSFEPFQNNVIEKQEQKDVQCTLHTWVLRCGEKLLQKYQTLWSTSQCPCWIWMILITLILFPPNATLKTYRKIVYHIWTFGILNACRS